MKGLVIVSTGDGKGKTTAAFGTAFRAAGQGKQVAILQFIKGPWESGEVKAAKRFPNIMVERTGSGYTWSAEDPEEPRRLARHAWARCLELVAGDQYDLLVLDELNCVLAEGYVSVDEVLAMLDSRPARLNIIITGRGAPDEVIAAADTATEMRSLKHAFDAGIPARRGIEY